MQTNKKTVKFSIILCLFFAGMLSSLGQSTSDRPFSMYGLGDSNHDKVYRNQGIGGVSYAFRSPLVVNYSNPASYTAFDTLSFVFETGILSDIFQHKGLTQELPNYSDNTNLSYIIFGFRVTPWWGASAGFLPVSNMGYSMNVLKETDGMSDLEFVYTGNGGITKFYVGNAFKLSDNFSFGFNASYLFGNISKIREIQFLDDDYAFVFEEDSKTNLNDFVFNYGIQYETELNDEYKLSLGLVSALATDISAKRNIDDKNSLYDIIDVDTIISISEEGAIVYPGSIGGGVVLSKTDKWMIGADLQWEFWKDYSVFGLADSLETMRQAAIGAEYSTKKFKYRMGLRASQTSIIVNNNRLNEIGISFGVGVPLRGTKTSLNFSVEAGQRGTLHENLIQERYAKFTLAISVHEHWFFKRKFE